MEEDLTPNIELRFLNYRLKILSVKKTSIHKLMYPLAKIAFTKKTECSFFSFDETNDDFSIVVDLFGYEVLSPYLVEEDITLSQSDWIPMFLCGDDLPGSKSLSKIAKYLILPLADSKISIMAISMFQCDYVLIQDKDYETVIKCLSNHIPKIYDEALGSENELIFDKYDSTTKFHFKSSTLTHATGGKKQRKITLPLLIPDGIEYCITGLYDLEKYSLIIPTLMEIMFFETTEYEGNEIFFNFTKKESDISIVMETKLFKKFPEGTIAHTECDFWKLVRIGQAPVGFEVFGVCASVSQPLELANIDEYYISSYHTGYCFIPANKLDLAREFFAKGKARFVDTSKQFANENEPATRDERARERSSAQIESDMLANSDSNSSAHNGSELYNRVGSMNEEADSRDTDRYEQFPLDGEADAAASSMIIMNAMRCQDDDELVDDPMDNQLDAHEHARRHQKQPNHQQIEAIISTQTTNTHGSVHHGNGNDDDDGNDYRPFLHIDKTGDAAGIQT